jgi:hypothetical protein
VQYTLEEFVIHRDCVRALVLNNDKLAEKIKQAANEPMDARSLGSDNVNSAVKEALDATGTQVAEWTRGQGGLADASAHLLTQLAGPLVRHLAPVGELTAHHRALLLAMGAMCNKKFIRVTFGGTKKAFQEALARQLIKASGQVLDEATMKRALRAQMRRMDIQRTVLKGDKTMAYFTVIDADMAKAMGASVAAGATDAQRAAAIATALKTPEDLDKAFGAFERVGKLNVRLGVVTGILQALSLTKALDDDLKAMAHETTEAKHKVIAAYTAVIGTTTEVFGLAASRGKRLVLAASRGMWGAQVAVQGSKVLQFVGRLAGAVAGLLVAVWDAVHAVEEREQGNVGMALLYGVSAGVGLAVALGSLGIWAALTSWLPILFIVLVVVVVLIEVFKDNKIQDWMERTLWGEYRDEYKKNNDPYQSTELEMGQFKIAVEADWS